MITMDRALASSRYSDAVIEKARRLFVIGKVRQDPEYPNIFWVGSGSGGAREYRVELYEHFASCSCAHGIHTGADATCAHPLAAMAYAKANGLEITERGPDADEPSGLPEGHVIYRTDPGRWDDELPEMPF